MDTLEVEQRLRAALAARAGQVGPQDLRPANPPGLREARAVRRSRRLALALAAPATLAVVIGAWVVVDRPAHNLPGVVSGSSHAALPLTMTASSRTSAVTGTNALVTYPVPVMSGGQPAAARRAETVLTEVIDGRLAGFRTTVGTGEPADNPPTLEITVGVVARWRNYLSVRFDQIADYGGAHPDNTAAAVVIDTDTGSSVGPARLFTDVGAVDQLMREAISQAAGPSVDATGVRGLTMTPGAGGSTRPLAWYPAADGLHWVVDRCAIAACAVTQPAAVLPWDRLAALTVR